jgi:hypothetical protein
MMICDGFLIFFLERAMADMKKAGVSEVCHCGVIKA